MRDLKTIDNEREHLLEKNVRSHNNDNDEEEKTNKYYFGLKQIALCFIQWIELLLWWWVNPIIRKGYNQILTDDDLDDLPHEDKCSTVLNKFQNCHWLKTNKTWRIVLCVFWKETFYLGIFTLFYSICRIAQPLLLREIIRSIYHKEDKQFQNLNVYIYVVLLFFCLIIHGIIYQYLFFRSLQIGTQIRIGLTSTIYQHLLSINQSCFEYINAAQAINLIANDTSKFEEFWVFLHFLWSAPLEGIIVFILLCFIIGPLPTLFAYIMLFLLLIIQVLTSHRAGFFYRTITIAIDKRIKAFSELLNGCNIIKMYNWEKSIEERINQLRQVEINGIKQAGYFRAINLAIHFVLPCLMSLVACTGVWLQGNQLIVTNVFSGLLFFNIIRLSLTSFLPKAVERLNIMFIASKRIDEFMQLTKVQSYTLNHIKQNNEYERIVMHDASFSWGNNNICLKSININIKSGQLVGIIGPVGAGKSSLFASILGEMNKINGEININGSFSYATQSSWIFADTIRANILFGKPMNMERYTRVLHACCLDVDLNDLGQIGDLTILGDQGINLSGGQKARISLARALYTDADIYLFDDPLAAVDVEVAKQIYNTCLSSQGLLKNKTRLLITHQIHLLSDSDQIILLIDGSIETQGSFDQILTKQNYIQQIKTNMTTKMTSDDTTIMKYSQLEINKSIIDHKSIITEETSIIGKMNWSVYLKLLNAPPLGWFGLCLLIVLLLISQGTFDGSNICLAIWSTSSYRKQQEKYSLNIIYFILVLCALFSAILVALFWFYVILQGTNFLHNKMLKGIVYTSMRFFESNPTGRILNRASRDQHIIDKLLPETLFDSLQALLTTLAALIIICIVNPLSLFLLFPLLILFLFLYRYYSCTNRQLKRLESISRSPVYNLFSSSLNGLMIIRAFKVKDDFVETFAKHLDIHSRAHRVMRGAIHWFGLRLDLMAALFSLVIAILILIDSNKSNSALAALSLMYSLTMINRFQWGATQFAEAMNYMISAERISEYSHLLPEEDYGGQKGLIQISREWPIFPSIEFRNYTLRYRSQLEPTIKNIHFYIKPNEKIGIIGRTGAGKSSLFQGIFRLIDRSVVNGQILIDNIDINQITLNQLRANLSIIPQSPVLFSATLRYNLDPSNTYTDEQYWNALEAVQLKQRIASHPDGLDLLVSEGGSNFSVGERQLICVARAIIKKSKILLIDEATTNIDQVKQFIIFEVKFSIEIH